jgi:ubiquitin-like modifier-activating enzyme ATG7
MIDRLAEEAAGLNLKLIKWRLLPNLDLSLIAKTRCLLVGAGTLGCNVTRCLLAWGVSDITLIDNGRVSFSNPVRQSLFTHEDCLNGGKPKAEAAAQRAIEICPFANVKGYQMAIPMPGHNVTDEYEFVSACTELDQLVRNHDVVFLLTDSRESRWLPGLLGAVYNKIVVTVALGFDSFVAMRHGAPGEPIGCYFCHDVNTPTDTLSGRTLDQQCTVTRPGLSYMASATAVELLVSVLQHPQGNRAPASPATFPTEPLPLGSSILGLVPHQVRGFVSHLQNLILSGEQFECCSACSKKVIEHYREHGIEFIRKAVSESDYLDNVTGLADLRTSEQARIDAFLDDMASSDNDF